MPATPAPAGTTARTETGPTPTTPPRARRLALVAALVAAVLTALLWLPRPPSLGPEVSGDADLAARARTASAGLDLQGLAVATGSRGGPVRTAALGAADARPDSRRAMTAGTPQEIGSVTKSLTGLLLADAVARGEVEATTTLGEIYPDAGLDAGLATVTLDELATHRSGLGVVGGRRALGVVAANLSQGNPYRGQTPASVLQEAQQFQLGGGTRGEFTYSNLGYALLGHALAEVAGIPYPDLLRQRVLDPLGMGATLVDPDPRPAGHAHEVDAAGRDVADWRSAGSAPAGTGVWSTAEDLGRLMAAVAAGTAPGQDAVRPRGPWQGGESGSGWGFFRAEVQGRTLLLNNGATAGGVSSVALDPATGDWVALTAPSAVESQTIAFRLLGLDVAPPTTAQRLLTLPVGVTLGLVLVAVLAALRHGLRPRIAPSATRLGVLDGVLGQVLLVALLAGIGAWAVVPPGLFAVAVGAATFSAVVHLARWRVLPGPSGVVPVVGTGFSLLVSVVLLALLLGGWPG
ncbi:serine hydrolase domain-containing protein [Kineococcus gynurae]|uniref:Serine hydrolase domain-containing protein n=1 Tax=Kineococcus gynurae TaxID=452979 RepID=A0ABV5LMZ7_9ACTN